MGDWGGLPALHMANTSTSTGRKRSPQWRMANGSRAARPSMATGAVYRQQGKQHRESFLMLLVNNKIII
jgi:hypothetical protein